VIKNSSAQKAVAIFYLRRPESEIAREKLDFLLEIKIKNLIKDGDFVHIIPDKYNNWIDLSEKMIGKK